MKLLIGQLAVIFLVLGGCGLIYMTYSQESYNYTILLGIWTTVLVLFGIWTRTNPKKAFLAILIYYALSVLIKDAMYGGEYILTFIFHCYFVCSMLVGMTGTQEEFKQLNGG